MSFDAFLRKPGAKRLLKGYPSAPAPAPQKAAKQPAPGSRAKEAKQ